MDIGAIDRSATRGGGALRAASPVAKLVALGVVLGAVLTTWNLLVLAAIVVTLFAALVWGRIDVRLASSLAGYPAVFALVFAFASAPDLMTGAVIVLKSVSAALAAVTVILSTPYPQVFAPLQRITPGIVGDALLMTYRATFILLGKFGDLLRAARLRAGLRGRHPVRSARLTAAALGGLLLYSLDLAQRDYDIMRVRGYSGRLRITPARGASRAVDAAIVATAVWLLMAAVIWRLGASALNPYSWMVPVPALVALAASGIRRKESA